MNSIPPGKQSKLFIDSTTHVIQLATFASLALALMITDYHSNLLQQMRSVASLIVYPIHAISDVSVSSISYVIDFFSSRKQLIEKNNLLQTSLLTNQIELLQLESLKAENTRLLAMMDSVGNAKQKFILSNLKNVSLDPYNHRILLDKGSSDGIFVGQALLDDKGVMGQITDTTPISAFAMLISDSSHAIPVMLNRTGLRTIAFGTGSMRELVLPNIPPTADIQSGDLLVSSGLGDRFPPGFPVAVILRTEYTPGDRFATSFAEPSAALDRGRQVLLIWPQTQHTPNTLETPSEP